MTKAAYVILLVGIFCYTAIGNHVKDQFESVGEAMSHATNNAERESG